MVISSSIAVYILYVLNYLFTFTEKKKHSCVLDVCMRERADGVISPPSTQRENWFDVSRVSMVALGRSAAHINISMAVKW